MERLRFDVAVPVILPSQPSVVYNVANVFQAVDILINKWPKRGGRARRAARKACLMALEETASVELARETFERAAEEAGILVR